MFKGSDWMRIIQEHHIPYVDRGPNVKRGEWNIACPFGGSADPSYHMGLNLETGYWACWRNSNHRGKSPLRLLVQLLGVPYGKARQIAGITEDSWRDPDGFDALAARLMGRTPDLQLNQVQREFLQYPKEFRHIDDYGVTQRAWEYLAFDREFGERNVDDVCELYGLRTAVTGPYKMRVILPYYMDGDLVAWTGRAITKAELRYRDLEVEGCLVEIRDTVYNHDALLEGGTLLVVQEGPFDALKLDYFGREHGIRSVALSTNTITDEQIYLIAAYATNFNAVAFMMDNTTGLGSVDSWRMQDRVKTIPRLISPIAVPYGLKDSGELSPRQADDFARQLRRTYGKRVQPSHEHALRGPAAADAAGGHGSQQNDEVLRTGGGRQPRRSFGRH